MDVPEIQQPSETRTDPPPILRLEGVSKSYGEKVAVNQLNVEMPTGSMLGLLGPNGAGKTSLIRMITTITQADTGTIYFHGEPLSRLHPRQIGYLPEERGLYRKMYVGEQLLYLGRLKGMRKADAESAARQWLEVFELGTTWTQKVEELSKGMQQQVQFIATVMHEPQLLILDEPFSGLDPINTNRLKREVLRLNAQGTSVIFSTHRMEQVEEICQDIVLIHRGNAILNGRLADLREQYRQNRFELVLGTVPPPSFWEPYAHLSQVDKRFTLQLRTDQPVDLLLRQVLDANLGIRSFRELLPSLNELFIRLVGPEAEEAQTNEV